MPTARGFQADFGFALPEGTPPAGVSRHLTEWAPERWSVAQDWRLVVDRFLASDPAQRLGAFLRSRLSDGAIIYPPEPFRALALTPLTQVKVLILGQDPYHGPGQAEGLAFSVAPGVKPPPSLRNIFKEIARDPELGCRPFVASGNGSLASWATQGVLLLNTCLTVEDGKPASHAQRGWEALTDEIVMAVGAKNSPVVFMLWGVHAQAKQGLIRAEGQKDEAAKAGHLVLTANHPSPLSAMRPPQPFLGCGHFGQANAYLRQHGCAPIDW